MTAVKIGVLLPATFNLNADAANADVLVRRFTLSGYDAEVVPLDDPAEFSNEELDALIIGSPSSSVLADPALPRAEIATLVQRLRAARVPILAISNGFHLLGTMTGRDGAPLEGLGIIPVHTTFGTKQHVTIGALVDTGSDRLIGVENHNARVEFTDTAEQFAGVIRGTGNGTGGPDGFEAGSLTGTHLHGPLFALNPELADSWCRFILSRRGETFTRGAALDELDRLAHAAAAHLERQATS
ncbi:MAG: hypothetical protein RLZZ319_480 [Actinomycetota bacterium]